MTSQNTSEKKRNFLPPLGSLEFALIMNADVRYRYVQPQNAKAWAIGHKLRNGRMSVRRIVWGRLMARAEKRDGEIITAARILVRRKEQFSANERWAKEEAISLKKTRTIKRASKRQAHQGVLARPKYKSQPSPTSEP